MNETTTKYKTNPIKAIREKCKDCCGYEDIYIRILECEIPNCALYPFRLGKNPYRKREYTEEQKAKFKERAQKMIATKKANKQSSQIPHSLSDFINGT